MPGIDLVKTVDVERTPRVKQVEGMFDLDKKETSTEAWSFSFELPDGWNVGLIVGPSGCGKSTVAHELWPGQVYERFDWPQTRSVLDGFDEDLGIRRVTELMSRVGFSSPPLWLRPYGVPSRGERFRCDLARALSLDDDPIVIDEFTSVVDRDVGQVGSAAVAKCARKHDKRFVAVTCHEDVVEWLEPDWVMRPETESVEALPRGSVRRPDIDLEIRRCSRGVWRRFRKYHYLNHSLGKNSACWVAFWRNKAVAFTAVIPFPHPYRPGWREHRTVCRPNYQGVGIGNAMSDFVASIYKTSKPYYSRTSHPAMIYSRNKSRRWKMTQKPGHVKRAKGSTLESDFTQSRNRLCATFRYVGDARPELARKFGVLKPSMNRSP